jgi:RHS repeat-associated protein
MIYDGDGNRVSETSGGTTTKYLIDTLNPTGYSQVLDELVNGSVTKTYTYGLQRISENQLAGSTWTPTFYGYDGHGNVRFTTNTAGMVGNTYQFDAFGMPIASAGMTANTYLYSGERFDSSLNLYLLRARYYNHATGRFETMDPILGKIFNPDTLHKYVYSAGNPVNRIDPSGKDDIEEYDTVTFSRVEGGFTHGYYNHFTCSLLGEEAIIAAITQAILQVAGSGANLGGTFEGLVEVDFQQIIYRAFPRAGTGCINVSTFFPPPLE